MKSTPTILQKVTVAIANERVTAELFGFGFFSFCFPVAIDGGG